MKEKCTVCREELVRSSHRHTHQGVCTALMKVGYFNTEGEFELDKSNKERYKFLFV